MSADLVPQRLLEQAALRFRLLGDPLRLQLLNLLHVRGEQHVNALAEATGQRQANTSKHLRRMADAGLLGRRSEGLHVFYRIEDPTLAALCLLVCGQLRAEAEAAPPPG